MIDDEVPGHRMIIPPRDPDSDEPAAKQARHRSRSLGSLDSSPDLSSGAPSLSPSRPIGSRTEPEEPRVPQPQIGNPFGGLRGAAQQVRQVDPVLRGRATAAPGEQLASSSSNIPWRPRNPYDDAAAAAPNGGTGRPMFLV